MRCVHSCVQLRDAVVLPSGEGILQVARKTDGLLVLSCSCGQQAQQRRLWFKWFTVGINQVTVSAR